MDFEFEFNLLQIRHPSTLYAPWYMEVEAHLPIRCGQRNPRKRPSLLRWPVRSQTDVPITRSVESSTLNLYIYNGTRTGQHERWYHHRNRTNGFGSRNRGMAIVMSISSLHCAGFSQQGATHRSKAVGSELRTPSSISTEPISIDHGKKV